MTLWHIDVLNVIKLKVEDDSSKEYQSEYIPDKSYIFH
jgi:hypothetical protein